MLRPSKRAARSWSSREVRLGQPDFSQPSISRLSMSQPSISRLSMSLMSKRLAAVTLLGASIALASCGGTSNGASDTPVKLNVLMASSFAPVAQRVTDRFEKVHPDTTVELSTGASNALVEQVLAGSPADVVVTADEATAKRVVEPGNAPPVAVATNEIALVVPKGNPGKVRSLKDLSNPDLAVGLCAAPVPCGKYARDLLQRAGVTVNAVTEEPDVRSLMAKIVAGELDAAVVYRTDVIAAGSAARQVPVPLAKKIPVRYFAVVRGRGAEAAAARRHLRAEQFVDYLRGTARAVTQPAGFGPP